MGKKMNDPAPACDPCDPCDLCQLHNLKLCQLFTMGFAAYRDHPSACPANLAERS